MTVQSLNMQGAMQGLMIGGIGKARKQGDLFMSMLNMVMSGNKDENILASLTGEADEGEGLEGFISGNTKDMDSKEMTSSLPQMTELNMLASIYGIQLEQVEMFNQNVLESLRDKAAANVIPVTVKTEDAIDENMFETKVEIPKGEAIEIIDSIVRRNQTVEMPISQRTPNEANDDGENNPGIKIMPENLKAEDSGAKAVVNVPESVQREAIGKPEMVKQATADMPEAKSSDVQKDISVEKSMVVEKNTDAEKSTYAPVDVKVVHDSVEPQVREVTIQVSDESSKIAADIKNILKDEITIAVKDGKQEINMELYPKELGKINVKLNIEEGTLRVSIKAENPEVQAIIKSSSAELMQVLKTGTIENVAVKVQEPEVMHNRAPEVFDRNAQSDMTNHQGNHDNRRHNEYYADDNRTEYDGSGEGISFEDLMGLLKSYNL